MTIYLENNAFLQALAAKVFGYNGRQFNVNPAESITCTSYWDGGSKTDWAVVMPSGSKTDWAVVTQIGSSSMTTTRNMQVSEMGISVWFVGECGSPFSPPAPTFTVTPDMIVIAHSIFCGKDMGITFYVHPSRLPALLPAPSAALSREQRIVLCATRSLKSSYAGISNFRFHEAHQQTGISLADWDRSKAELISMGLLNKAGAITVSGRNAIGQYLDLYQFRNGANPE